IMRMVVICALFNRKGEVVSKRRFGPLVLLAGAGFWVSPAMAQSGQEAVKTMGTVVVTASGFEQDIREAPASISVVTREQLERGAYKDLTDALRDVPGVITTPSDNNTTDISLRGMSAN